MQLILLSLPIPVLFAALFIYRHTGKREFLKFDLVQFIYAFVIAPILFVWSKSFLFYLLRNELNFRLSPTELFMIDTGFSVVAMFLFAFVMVHSLTKSFNLKLYKDPLYDLFTHSEYFHLWLTHLALFIGPMIMVTFFSIVNLYIPLEVYATKGAFLGFLGLSWVIGLFGFMAVWMSDIEQANFMRIMKLCFALFFMIHASVYFFYDPSFAISYGVYWFGLMFFAAASFVSLFAEKSERATNFIQRWKHGKSWQFKAILFK